MNKIKPCPFCGTKVELSKNPLWQGSRGYYNCFEFEIVCPKCGCNVTYNENDTVYRTEEEAINNVINVWNERKNETVVTPNPKGHGRLIDANRLRSMYSINRANFNTVVGIQKWIDEAPTIIEADRSEENG